MRALADRAPLEKQLFHEGNVAAIAGQMLQAFTCELSSGGARIDLKEVNLLLQRLEAAPREQVVEALHMVKEALVELEMGPAAAKKLESVCAQFGAQNWPTPRTKKPE